MALGGVMAVISRYFTEFGGFEGQLRQTSWGYDLWQYSKRLLKKSALKRGVNPQSKAKILLVQYCIAISATAEPLYLFLPKSKKVINVGNLNAYNIISLNITDVVGHFTW